LSTSTKGATHPATKWVPPGNKMEVMLNQCDLNSGQEHRASNLLSWGIWEETRVQQSAWEHRCHADHILQTSWGNYCQTHNASQAVTVL